MIIVMISFLSAGCGLFQFGREEAPSHYSEAGVSSEEAEAEDPPQIAEVHFIDVGRGIAL